MIRKSNISKYGSDIISADGCGGCYKCADEYLFKVKFGLVPYRSAYANRCIEVKAAFDRKYKTQDFNGGEKRKFYGGKPCSDVQVLCDRCGYYIGTLQFDDKTTYKWYTDRHFGSRHYQTREEAEAVCAHFKKLYRL